MSIKVKSWTMQGLLQCLFCQEHKEDLNLVHHLSGGVSYGCGECVKDSTKNIRTTLDGVYYTK